MPSGSFCSATLYGSMDFNPMKKGLLALVPVLALAAAAPAFAGESGTFGRIRTYSETGTRTVSTVGTVDDVSYSLDTGASGTGSSGVATGSYTVGSPLVTTATSSSTSTGSGISSSADVVTSSMVGATFSDIKTSTFTDTVADTLTGVFAY